MLRFNEQIERIGEVAIVLLIGMLLWAVEWRLARPGWCCCCSSSCGRWR